MELLSEPQAKLLKKKLYWTLGRLTTEEREALTKLADEQKLGKADASIIIEDLYKLTIPSVDDLLPEGDAEKRIALQEIRNVLKRYVPDLGKGPATVTCSKCLQHVTSWYEEDYGMILCLKCREAYLSKTPYEK